MGFEVGGGVRGNPNKSLGGCQWSMPDNFKGGYSCPLALLEGGDLICSDWGLSSEALNGGFPNFSVGHRVA